jgi:transketolase
MTEQGTMTENDPTLIDRLRKITNLLRRESLRMIYQRQAGHPGGSLSAAEIMAVLYFQRMHVDPAHPDWPDRDRFLLSKGHASALLYAALVQRGFIQADESARWGQLDCPLQGHPDRLTTPGVEMNSGILGHGIPIGVGLALSARLAGKNYRTYVLLGDGECQGGIVWEGAQTAAKYRLDRLTAIVDCNAVQLDGPVDEIMPLGSFVERWRALGWFPIEVDGHDVLAILRAFDWAEQVRGQPVVILAHTIKGKGVSFMENQSYWHGNVPSEAQYVQAMAELEAANE